MVTEPEIAEQDRRITRTAASVMAYLKRQPEPVEARELLDIISKQDGVPATQVATAISRVADNLIWDYSQGSVHFRLA